MDQVQCAILKTFENTVKVLMENNRGGYDSSSLDNIFEQLQSIRQSISELSSRINRMEMKCNCNMDSGDDVWDTLPWPVEPKNIIIQGKRDIPDIFESAPIPLCPVSAPVSAPVTKTVETVTVTVPVPVTKKVEAVPVPLTKTVEIVPVASSKMDIEEDVEGDVEDVEDAAADAADEEGDADADADAEEEEGLEEFEYKGKTYYRDSEGNVYTLDDDGELNDTPVGRWNSTKSTIRFITT
jgi:hypothetical protein